ncbi:PilZ domain-containing protein [Nitrospira sp. NS4]|uniref:PilZ domain-containing protein n=1 Tax=Nitrospira sp. NS4 TaxID=3414498 RepID=UPI003C2B5130
MQSRGRERIGVDYPVTIYGEQGSGDGMLSNLTITGGEIDGPLDVAVGQTLRIHIRLTGARNPIDVAMATVRWKQDFRFGVEFVRFEGNAKAQLQDMLNQSDASPSS